MEALFGQQIGNPLRQVQQLQAAALPAHSGIGAHDFAEARAVDVRHSGEVEHDLLMTLIDQAVHLVLQQFIALTQRDLAFEIQYHHVARGPLIDLHGNAPR